jgi:hypothetical protein
MLLRVKRHHGLGNVLMLLPVLSKAATLGYDVALSTHHEWAQVS